MIVDNIVDVDNYCEIDPNNNEDNLSFGEIWEKSKTPKKIEIILGIIFLSIPVALYHNVPPLINWTYEKILLPIGRTIKKIAEK
ncbi:MAG: hypothetical protein WDZ28_05935, partial [Simkaniaceae bacterium]